MARYITIVICLLLFLFYQFYHSLDRGITSAHRERSIMFFRDDMFQTELLLRESLIGVPKKKVIESLDLMIGKFKATESYKYRSEDEIEYFPWRITFKDGSVEAVNYIDPLLTAKQDWEHSATLTR